MSSEKEKELEAKYKDAVVAYEAQAKAYLDLAKKVLAFERKFFCFTKDELKLFKFYSLNLGIERTKEIEDFENKIKTLLEEK